MFGCKYCGKEFERGFSLGAHTVSCVKNPNSTPSKVRKKYDENPKHCLFCNKIIPYELRVNKFCNRSCSCLYNNKKRTSDFYKKHGKALKKSHKDAYYKSPKKCIICKEKIEYEKRNRKTCSDDCRHIRNCELLKEHRKKYGRKAGLASAQKQAETRRSKNERLFAEKCKAYFNEVLFNKAIFNGWDADVIIEDIKVAVLWNGAWHYKKITKKHSVKQVQNRDRIKINEIKKIGYEPYVIKDMGKHNKEFVESEFIKFIEKFG